MKYLLRPSYFIRLLHACGRALQSFLRHAGLVPAAPLIAAATLLLVGIGTWQIQAKPAGSANQLLPGKLSAPNKQAIASAAATLAQNDATPQGTSTGRPQSPSAPSRQISPPPLPSYQLIVAPEQITLDVKSGTSVVQVASANGTAFPAPVITVPNNIMASFLNGPLPGVGTPKQQASWQLNISSIDKTATGQGYIELSTGHTSTRFLVKWLPVPAIDVVKGAVVRTDGADTITYTLNFTVNPNSTVPTAAHSLYMSVYDAPACINTAELSKNVAYGGGQQSYSLSCTVQRRPTYVPGTGYPPALNAGGSLALHVSITITPAAGYFIKSPQPLTFMTPDPYDQ